VKRSISLNLKIQLLTIVPLLVFAIATLFSTYQNTREALIYEKELALNAVISAGMGSVKEQYDLFKSGKITEEEAKKIAAKTVSIIRYGVDKSDYIWINDTAPVMIVHPTKSLIGKSLKDFQDKKGKYLFREAVKVGQTKDGGLINYWWASKDDKSSLVPKISYVKEFKPWGWILGTGIYVNDVNEYINGTLAKFILLTIGILTLMIFLVSFFVKRGVTAPLLKIASNLGETSSAVIKGSEETLETSDVLMVSNQEQASGLQETMSSLEEISAMIKRNADSATNSKESSNTSQNVAVSGKKTIDEMLVTINEISSTNERITQKMNENNEQFMEFLNMIKEISDKTNVINDIVFQTKLLSFNASVEAARAGEQGKGFSVVAEEVGNLANMSGKASEEISSLLEGSIHKVEAIVLETKHTMENLIKEGSLKIESGISKTHECESALEQIMNNVNLVNDKVGEISVACVEQSQGVSEINIAMTRLNDVSTRNQSASKNASKSAMELRDQADRLNEVIDNVQNLVSGRRAG
jgi:methyl-accepting chemotaxis protein